MRQYPFIDDLEQLFIDIDNEGGFMFKFLMLIGLGITLTICGVIMLIASPYAAYKKTKRQQKEINAESTK